MAVLFPHVEGRTRSLLIRAALLLRLTRMNEHAGHSAGRCEVSGVVVNIHEGAHTRLTNVDGNRTCCDCALRNGSELTDVEFCAHGRATLRRKTLCKDRRAVLHEYGVCAAVKEVKGLPVALYGNAHYNFVCADCEHCGTHRGGEFAKVVRNRVHAIDHI